MARCSEKTGWRVVAGPVASLVYHLGEVLGSDRAVAMAGGFDESYAILSRFRRGRQGRRQSLRLVSQAIAEGVARATDKARAKVAVGETDWDRVMVRGFAELFAQSFVPGPESKPIRLAPCAEGELAQVRADRTYGARVREHIEALNLALLADAANTSADRKLIPPEQAPGVQRALILWERERGTAGGKAKRGRKIDAA